MSHKEKTGFDTVEESIAYNKGREDEQSHIISWIKNWDGESKSPMSKLLLEKFNSLGKESSTLEKHFSESVDMLSEAKLQIEYLQQKFGQTGTGNSVISQIEQLLTKINVVKNHQTDNNE